MTLLGHLHHNIWAKTECHLASRLTQVKVRENAFSLDQDKIKLPVLVCCHNTPLHLSSCEYRPYYPQLMLIPTSPAPRQWSFVLLRWFFFLLPLFSFFLLLFLAGASGGDAAPLPVCPQGPLTTIVTSGSWAPSWIHKGCPPSQRPPGPSSNVTEWFLHKHYTWQMSPQQICDLIQIEIPSDTEIGLF